MVSVPYASRQFGLSLVIALLVCLFVTPLQASDTATIRVTAIQPSDSPPTASSASTYQLDVDFEILPSVTSSSLRAFPQTNPSTRRLQFTCLLNGEPVPNYEIGIVRKFLRPGDDPSGHLHPPGTVGPGAEDRPLGSFDPRVGNSGADATLEVVYEAPEISGVVRFRVLGRRDGILFGPDELDIGVRIPDLEDVSSSDTISFDPSTGHNEFNRSATSIVRRRLRATANDYLRRLRVRDFPASAVPEELNVTGISLPLGGLFDVDADENGQIDDEWDTPHVSHRFGEDVDIATRNLSTNTFEVFEKAAENRGFCFPVWRESPDNPAANHFHLRWRAGSGATCRCS